MSSFASLLTNPKGFMLIGVTVTLTTIFPFLGIVSALILAYLSQARENYGVLESSGVPVVPPTLFLGSEPNLHKTVMHLEDLERAKKYGGIWGSYVGRTPQIYVSDPELIKLIFVKDFVHFGDRQEMDFGVPFLNEFLDFQPGEKWKTLRTHLTPLFTTAKLKQMSDVIAESASQFMDDLSSECDENGKVKIDCRRRLTTWLIDMFAQSTLGVRLEDSKNPENKFASAFRDMIGENDEYNWLYSLSLSFPILMKLAPPFNDAPTKLIESTFRQVIDSRKRSGKKSSKDFLDLLCELMDRTKTKEFQDLGITEISVISQAINFFLGGYETSATTLSHLLLFMAEHPEIQEKMHEELMGHVREGKEIDHEFIKDIPYITACINESLRLAPPAIRPERICTKDWNHNGISIKKGTIVILAAWPANRNPEVYEKPDEFIPERWMSEIKSKYSFASFGFGPRNCIGMRFAYENLKLFACHLVKHFRVEKRHDTKVEYKMGSLLIVGFSPLYLNLVKRI